METGVIRQLPSGEFVEAARPVTDEERAVLAARRAVPALPAADANGMPAPGRAGVLARLRSGLNAAYTESAGVGAAVNGHADGSRHQPVDGPGEPPASETHRGASSTPDPGRPA